jgi:hypothetical protein
VVSGTGPAEKKVVVTDTSSHTLGSCTVKKDSTWEFRVKRSSQSVPGRVRATANRTTDEMVVTKQVVKADEDEHDD